MAIYIEIFKISEYGSLIEYKFQDEHIYGVIIFDKSNGKSQLKEINDPTATEWFFDRVEYKLKK